MKTSGATPAPPRSGVGGDGTVGVDAKLAVETAMPFSVLARFVIVCDFTGAATLSLAYIPMMS